MKFKKLRLISILLIIILITCMGIVISDSTETNLYRKIKVQVKNLATGTENQLVITCDDVNFYNALKNEIASYVIENNLQNKTITIDRNDVANITELELSNENITSIKGLENFTSLNKINISKNKITNIGSLSKLSNVSVLNLSNNNGITDFTPILNSKGLTELYLSSMGINNVEFLSGLSNVSTLDLSSNSISDISSITNMNNITNLNVSGNTSLTLLDDIAKHNTIKSLDISRTGITNLEEIYKLRNLTKLNIRSLAVKNLNSILEKDDNGIAFLSNLEDLDISYTKSVSFGNLSIFENLKNLYMMGIGITSLSGITALPGTLEYINLEGNNITKLDGIVTYKTIDKVVYVDKKLNATKLVFKNNKITDISQLADMDYIEYLDLSQNNIYDITAIKSKNIPTIYLQNQTFAFNVFEKKNEENQYIILPNIFQECKNKNGLIYNENTEFMTDGMTLNQGEEYKAYGFYNVIITPEKTTKDTLTATIKGGVADGTILTYKLSTSTSSIDSLTFKDPKLDEAIYEYFRKKAEDSEIKFCLRAPKILNLYNSDIIKLTTLDVSNKDIEYLEGLGNFTGLTNLNISENKITNINELQYCTKIQVLNIANSKIGDNNTALEKLVVLTNLDVSNTGMTKLDTINKLIEYWISKKRFTLKDLNIASNGLNDISQIEKITTLEKLNVSNNKIDDISEIGTLINLNTLNLGNNMIKNIEYLSTMSKLKTLDINNNLIEDISPVSNIAITYLDISGNKMKDISCLSKMTSLVDLEIGNNKIEDVTPIEPLLINSSFSAKQQKIVRILKDDSAIGNVEIELPKIFISAKDSSSKVYAPGGLTFENCKLSTDDKKVVITGNLEDKIARVIIKDGNAKSTTLAIAPALKGTIRYSTEEKTNQNVTATITFNRGNVTIVNNEGNNTYTFDKNGEFEFVFKDEYGFEGKEKASVTWIDKEGPKCTVEQQIIDGKVKVTITADEEMQEIAGWTIAENKLSMTKVYEESANEKIEVKDLLGNETELNIVVNIDKIPPEITGVEEGKIYDIPVIPIITDDNLDTIELLKDDIKMEGFKSGSKLVENGKYKLTATDKFGNSTIINFEINITKKLDIITSEKYRVDEEKKIISKIIPGITLEQLKSNVESDGEYIINDSKGNEIRSSDRIGTGYKIKFDSGKEYTLVVYGDLNGDGKIDVVDIAKLQKVLARINSSTELINLASNLKEDSKIDLNDLARLQKLATGQNIFK